MQDYKIDLETLTKKMQDRIAEARRNYHFWEVLEEVLTPREGQQITKRIATAMEKHPDMEGYYVSYSKDYHLYEIRIWQNGISWDNRVTLYLGHKSWDKSVVDRIDLEEIRKHCKWAILEKGRADDLEAAMDKLPELVARWNAACDAVMQVHKDASVVESLKYEFYLPFKRS